MDPHALGSRCCLDGSFRANGQHLTSVVEMEYLMTFVASPSAHPIGPHGGEECQVVAVGLRQKHGLPRMQGEAGAGIPLLRKQDRGRVMATIGVSASHRSPALSSWDLAPFS